MRKEGIALVGNTLSKKCAERLRALGFEVVLLSPYSKLGKEVASHADLLFFILEGKIFAHKEYLKENHDVFSAIQKSHYETFYIDECPSARYPNDTLMNCLVTGRIIFAKKGYTAQSAKDLALSEGYCFSYVNQGYARCTAIPVSDNAIVSADPSILAAARAHGLDTLEVTQGHVKLHGYEYGFIGGACGVCGDSIYFAGDLFSHPDGEAIADFCKAHKMHVKSLSDEPLCDVGSIFFI